MGFWDFLKKNIKKVEKEEIENKEISIKELESWLLNEKTEIKKQEDVFIRLIKERIFQLIQEIEKEIPLIEQINVEEKKAEEKIKQIVKENLDNYIYYLKILIDNLKNIKEENNNITEKVNSIFFDFEKKSKINYEKATFLIGKELGKVRENIINFFKNLEKILKENQDLINKLKTISIIEEKTKNFSEIKKIISKIEENIQDHNNKLNNLEKEIKIKEDEIEKIKKSEKFNEQEKQKQELKRKKEKLDEEIFNLRKNIDFKSLANFFHSFEREMNIIKDYKENFKETFQKTNGEDIIYIIQEAKLPDSEIIEKIEKIKGIDNEIKNTIIIRTGIGNLDNEIKNTILELETFNSKKDIKRKKQKKQEKNLNEIIDEIKKELIKINVELITA